MKRFFITGIGTGVGKTLVAAVLTEALQADYWKPVQAGDTGTDTQQVQKLISNKKSFFHPSSYLLHHPFSPHAAADMENVEIKLSNIKLPAANNHLIIEGAGGLLVPLNQTEFVIDLITHLQAAVILVSRHYLGSINHTLLAAEALNGRNIPVAGIIFNGNKHKYSEEIILKHTGYSAIGRIEEENRIDNTMIQKYAEAFKTRF